MRMLSAAVSVAALILACSNDSTTSSNGSTTGLPANADAAVLTAFGAGAWVGGVGADGIEGVGHLGWRLNELPDSLALTADQQAAITALVDAFKTSNSADLDALSAIREQAEAAREAGVPEDSVHAILESGDAVRARLHAAEQELVTRIEAILTDEQKAYLSARTCGACDSTVAPLTDEQKASIDSLVAAFEAANADDIAAVKAGGDEAQAALERLRAARDVLQARINALLTPEQIASGCYLQRGAPRDRGGHGGHGPQGGPDGDHDGRPEGIAPPG
jgi:Spy/CpxP family protein refolding chaperone